MRLILTVGVLVALATAAAASAAPGFRTPSRNIGCTYATAPTVLRCDVLSGLQPEPRRRCELDWTGISLAPTGRAVPTCAGDTAYPHGAPVLAYGRTWKRGGISCVSRRAALRCRNRSGHGFELARERWKLF